MALSAVATVAATATAAALRVVHVAASALYVSRPPPHHFGNPPDANNAAHPWLVSRFHFAFAEWRAGPPRFGVLRVLNDDVVAPARGFGEHPHRDMEIVTYVVSGQLTHRDSMRGADEALGPGAVQYMTAGTGVRHSERNAHATEHCRLLQLWILPRRGGLTPNYGSLPRSTPRAPAIFHHLVGDVAAAAPAAPANEAVERVYINQDANVYAIRFDAAAADATTGACDAPQQRRATFALGGARQLYIVAIEGPLDVAGVRLARHEAATVVNTNADAAADVHVVAADGAAAHALLVEMAAE